MNKHTKPVSRSRVLAEVLYWLFTVGIVLVFSRDAIGHWPFWAWIVAITIGTTIGLAILIFVAKDLSHLTQGRRLRFSLRGLLLLVPIVSVVIWMFIQLDWIEKRERWRRHNAAAVRATQGRAPAGLVRLFEPGVSRIEIKNGSTEQIEYAKRLFPEATVIEKPSLAAESN